MKEDRRTDGERHHEAVPDDRGPQSTPEPLSRLAPQTSAMARVATVQA